jgi:hypothetical protein
LRPYFPGGQLNALASAPQGSIPATPSCHRLQRGLPGYLILFASHAFASQRQYLPREPPSPLVFLPISTNFTSTPGIPLSSSPLQSAVSSALPGLSPGISRPTYQTAYTRFTPSNSEQRLHPLSYRGCWHRVSRCLLRSTVRHGGYSPPYGSFSPTGLYNPKAFFTHAASLRQAFAHCARFPTAASRRSLDRVSVPVWLIILSDQLPVVALVSRYLTN